MLRYFDSFNYYLATPAGLEPATSCVTGMRSSQLNYGAIFDIWVGHTPLLSSSPVSVKYGLFNGLQSTPNPSYCGILGFPDFFIKDSKFCLMVLPARFELASPAWKADNLANLSMGACGGRSNPPFFVLCNCAWLLVITHEFGHHPEFIGDPSQIRTDISTLRGLPPKPFSQMGPY